MSLVTYYEPIGKNRWNVGVAGKKKPFAVVAKRGGSFVAKFTRAVTRMEADTVGVFLRQCDPEQRKAAAKPRRKPSRKTPNLSVADLTRMLRLEDPR